MTTLISMCKFKDNGIICLLFFCIWVFHRHIGLLRVKGKKMNLQKIPLQTVRQFFIQDVTLSEHPDLFSPEQPNIILKVMAFCQEKVHATQLNMLLKTSSNWTNEVTQYKC